VVYVIAGSSWMLLLGTPIFGMAIGIATTAAYTAASSVMPSTARGTGFGLLSTGSLAGLALSPMINGMLAATSIRAVFVLDVIALVALALGVSRLMIVAPLDAPTAPATEEL
jgi:MFS family permease